MVDIIKWIAVALNLGACAFNVWIALRNRKLHRLMLEELERERRDLMNAVLSTDEETKE